MGRKYKQLSKEDRIKIYHLLSCNKTQKEIAQELKVHPSAICRELKRNALKRGCYHYQSAKMASERKEQLKNCPPMDKSNGRGSERKITIRLVTRTNICRVLTERFTKFTFATKFPSISCQKKINHSLLTKSSLKRLLLIMEKNLLMHKYIEQKLNTSIYFTHPHAAL